METIFIPGIARQFASSSIVWVRAEGNYSWIHFSNGHRYLGSQTLKWYEQRLTSFLRIHKSSLVNPDHIVAVERRDNNEWHVVMSDRAAVPVARRRYKAVTCFVKEDYLLI